MSEQRPGEPTTDEAESRQHPSGDAVAAPPPVKPKRSLRVWISYALFAVSAILFAVVLVMYLRDDDSDNPPPPTAQSGQYEMKDVMTALRDQGLEADYGRSADRAIGLTEVAQAVVVNGETIYVFIYPDPAQRERDQERLNMRRSRSSIHAARRSPPMRPRSSAAATCSSPPTVTTPS